MHEDSDSTFSAVIESKVDTLVYRLVNVRTGGFIEGTAGDGFVPNGIDGYSSYVLNSGGKTKIVFDPKKLPRSIERSSFEISSDDTLAVRVAESFAIYEDTRDAFRSSLYWHVDEFKMGEFNFNFEPSIDSLKGLLAVEPPGLVRQVLQLDLFGLEALSNRTRFVDVKTSRETLAGIPPGSVVWSLDPELISVALNQASYDRYQKIDFINGVLDENPMSRPKAVLLRDKIDLDFHSLDYADLPRYLSILFDQYGDSPEAVADRQIYSGDYIKIRNGEPAPSFSVQVLSNPNHAYSNKLFRGKFYILQFWSTKDSVSVDELHRLRQAYERYRKANLQIVSICVDSSRQVVDKFFKRESGIPWYKAFLKHGMNNPICKSFEVYSIPKAVLVDPHGTILAAGWDLRGDNLDSTLGKYLVK